MSEDFYNKGIEAYEAGNFSEAIDCWTKAAETGNAEAMHSLGVSYENGENVPKDLTKAVEWYQKAADAGYAGSLLNLANFYIKGEGGINRDYDKAEELLEKALAAGEESAKKNLDIIKELKAIDDMYFGSDKTTYAPGETITVKYKMSQSMVDAKAWIGIYGENAPHSNYGDYKYVKQIEGTVKLKAPAAGSWELRLYSQYDPSDETLFLKRSFKVEGASQKVKDSTPKLNGIVSFVFAFIFAFGVYSLAMAVFPKFAPINFIVGFLGVLIGSFIITRSKKILFIIIFVALAVLGYYLQFFK